MPVLRLAIIQMPLEIGDRKTNFAKLEKMLADNWTDSEYSTVVILPEIWDVGYIIEKAETYGDRDAAEAASFLGGLAKKYKCWFVGGSVLALTDQGAANRAMVVNPSGEYIAYYDKAHLIALMDEDKYLVGGNGRTHIKVDGVDLGLSICYDLRFPEWQRLYSVEGSELLVFSAEWPTSRIEHWKIMLQSRAVENTCYVAGCNRVGTTGNTPFGGASMVIDPWGEVLYQGGDDEEFKFVEIDSAKVTKAREFIKVFDARRPELYREN